MDALTTISRLAPEYERYPLIRSWDGDGFLLLLFKKDVIDHQQWVLAYAFFDRQFDRDPIFLGDQFKPFPMVAPTSDETVIAALDFFALKPGDTDPEYFKRYTDRQIAWCRSRASDLSVWIHDFRDPISDLRLSALDIVKLRELMAGHLEPESFESIRTFLAQGGNPNGNG